MKANIILSGKNDSSILDRQVKDCPDVSKKTVPQRIPRRYKEDMRGLQEIEAYLGLKKFLLRTFGVTLNIHSQKTKGGSDKNTAITQKQ